MGDRTVVREGPVGKTVSGRATRNRTWRCALRGRPKLTSRQSHLSLSERRATFAERKATHVLGPRVSQAFQPGVSFGRLTRKSDARCTRAKARPLGCASGRVVDRRAIGALVRRGPLGTACRRSGRATTLPDLILSGVRPVLAHRRGPPSGALASLAGACQTVRRRALGGDARRTWQLAG